MIEVNQLVKRYGRQMAVDHLSFKVEEGQIYGFLGPNGAGKSTTMNIMTGCLGATEGEVIINGHNILEEPEAAKRCIGYLPEVPPLYPDMTVGEYLVFVAELKKIPKKEREAQIQQVMEMTMLSDMSARLIKNLSKGYKQRVGLAQAILGFPPVIILDEPTVGLDPKQIIEIRELIKSLGQSHTVILSSHILQEVSAICDHILIISHGKLVASDTPENLERMMRRDSSLELEVKGRAEDAYQVIRRVSANEVQVTQAGDALVKCSISLEKNEDIREELFYAFAEARMPILAMGVNEVSLEKIFLELTADADAPEIGDERQDETGAPQDEVGAFQTGGVQRGESAPEIGNERQDETGAPQAGNVPQNEVKEADGDESDL